MSKTPLTDAAARFFWVPVEFSRTLERELTQANEAHEQMEMMANQLHKALVSIRSSLKRMEGLPCTCYSDPDHSCSYCNEAERMESALNEALGEKE
jgi:hypothetical protein